MTQIFLPLVGRFPRLARIAKGTWSLGGARTNPDLHDVTD